jgi:hypothetical protein
MKAVFVPFALFSLALCAETAQAQTTPSGSRVFVASHAGPKWDDRYSASDRAAKPVFEGGVSIGIDSPTAGVEVNLSVSQWHVRRREPQRFRYGGQTSGYLQKDHVYESQSTGRRRSPEVSVLFRKHRQASDVVTMTWLVGGAFAYRPSESVGITREVLTDGSLVEVHRQEERSTRNYFAAVAGLEATVRLSDHWSIVPRIRLTVFPNLADESVEAPRHFVVRPQLAVRWTF